MLVRGENLPLKYPWGPEPRALGRQVEIGNVYPLGQKKGRACQVLH